MSFWIFMLITDMLIPVSLIVFGKLLSKQIPKEINWLFGYRTNMSMKNQDTWEFAQRRCGKLMCMCGWVTLPATVIAMLFALGKDMKLIETVGAVACVLQLISIIPVIVFTEKALKKNFDKDGNKR